MPITPTPIHHIIPHYPIAIGGEWNAWRLRSSRTQAPVDFLAMQEPVFVLYGNAGYRELLGNFICNTRVFPNMQNHTLLLTSDEETRVWLESLGGGFTTGILSIDELPGSYDYGTDPFKRMMLLRGQALLSLLGYNKSVVWLEADAMYHQDLTLQDEIMHGLDSDLILYWDGTMHGGGFIRFAGTENARRFYAEIVRGMQDTHADDQDTMRNVIANMKPNFKVFDTCRYRNGLYYRPDRSPDYPKQCEGVRPVVQQHNWMIGSATKAEFAKRNGAWFLQGDSARCVPRDIRLNVMTMNRPKSLKRLLDSLVLRNGDTGAHDLQVTVDVPGDTNLPDEGTMRVLNEFRWPHGFFDVRVWPANVGIMGQWVDSFPCELYAPDLYTAFVMLEDDVEASPHYARWYIGAHRVYASPRVGVVTGMRPQLVASGEGEKAMSDMVPARGVKAFAYQLPGTWGLSPTWQVWRDFRVWFKEHRALSGFRPFVEGILPNEWFQSFIAAGTQDRMWEMWFIRFTNDRGLYTVYPWADGGSTGLVVGWKEEGLHYDGKDPAPDYAATSVWDDGLLLQVPLPFAGWDVRANWPA